jgi:hypothetical protein
LRVGCRPRHGEQHRYRENCDPDEPFHVKRPPSSTGCQLSRFT